MDKANQLFIPSKLKVGFDKRGDTYTGQLAYIIYYDKQGVLRKEKSWESWRDHKIKAQEVDNTPTEGFVLNKKVGGYKSDWNYRDAHVRVYDPRGFEFEIDVPNLLFILQQCDCNKGKGLEGKFVYAWQGTELVLLPVGSEEYSKSINFTELQGKQVSKKDLKPGITYQTKKQEELTYLGKFNYYFAVSLDSWRRKKIHESGVISVSLFWDGKDFVPLKDTKNLAEAKGDAEHPDFAKLVDKFNNSPHGSKVVSLKLKPYKEVKENTYSGYRRIWAFEKGGWFYRAATDYKENGTVISTRISHAYSLVNGVLQDSYRYENLYPDSANRYGRSPSINWVDPTLNQIVAIMENGREIKLEDGNFHYS